MDRVVARRPQPAEREELHRMKRQLASAVNSRHARIILFSTGGEFLFRNLRLYSIGHFLCTDAGGNGVSD